MPMSMQPINPELLKSLVSAGSVRTTTVIATPEGFSVCIKFGMNEGVLTTFRGNTRYFKSLHTLLDYFHGLGVFRIELDISNYQRE